MSFKVAKNFLVRELLDIEGRTVVYANKENLKLKIIYINHPSEKAVKCFNRIFNEIIQK